MPMKLRYPTRSLLLALALSSRAEDALPKPDPSFAADAPPGHSVHGDSFDEGPRRRLPLLPGCGNVSFPVTSSHPEVAAYFNQGVAQLHGFWYWEAERSFRTVLQLDPTCLMGHWGMAMANLENEERARKLIAKVTDDALKSVPPREKAWLESARKFFREKKNDNERKDAARDLVKDMERIAMDFPDDLEARAMAVCFIWRNQYRHGIEGSSHLATDALAQQVLAKNPLHRSTTISSTSGTTNAPNRPSPPPPCAAPQPPASPTCGTCPVTSTATSNAGTTPHGNRKPPPASITPR